MSYVYSKKPNAADLCALHYSRLLKKAHTFLVAKAKAKAKAKATASEAEAKAED